VVSNSTVLTFVQSMKQIHKFESEIIYYGNIDHYEQPSEREAGDGHKSKSIYDSLWTHSTEVSTIARAIINCTDILAEETAIVTQNVVIYTVLDYGEKNEAFIVGRLKQYLTSPPPELAKLKSRDIT
jgi:hypothetical protein